MNKNGKSIEKNLEEGKERENVVIKLLFQNILSWWEKKQANFLKNLLDCNLLHKDFKIQERIHEDVWYTLLISITFYFRRAC